MATNPPPQPGPLPLTRLMLVPETLALMTTKQVASRLVCCPRHVQNLVKRGHLPAVGSGRSLRFDPAKVQAFIDRGGTRGR